MTPARFPHLLKDLLCRRIPGIQLCSCLKFADSRIDASQPAVCQAQVHVCFDQLGSDRDGALELLGRAGGVVALQQHAAQVIMRLLEVRAHRDRLPRVRLGFAPPPLLDLDGRP